MAELVAVQSGLALFRTGEVGVVIDTVDLNPYDPQPLQAILASGPWDTDVLDVELSRACQELADTALEDAVPDVSLVSSENDARLVRVPKNVQDAVRSGLDTLRNNDAMPISLVAAGVAEKLLSGVVTVETARRIHAHFTPASHTATAAQIAFGGDSGRRWVAKVCCDEAMVAAAPPAGDALPADDANVQTGWVDPEKPHVYVILTEGDATCALCDKPEADPIHVPVDQAAPGQGPEAASPEAAAVEYFATFAPGGDEGRVFKVDSILAKDEEGSWWIRELGEWSPTQAPDESADLVMLDLESFNAAAEQLDEPGTAYAELSISEARLHELAMAEIDFDTVDAIFAAAPYVPTEVRSANAKKQLRDAKGHFILQGGVVQDAKGDRGTIARVDHAAGTVDIKGQDGGIKTVPANEVTVDKNAGGAPASPASEATAAPAAAAPLARLAAPAPLVTDVKGLIAQYQAKWAAEKSGPTASPVTAAADPLIPPPESPASVPPPSDTGPPLTPAAPKDAQPDDAQTSGDDPVAQSGVTPLYLAEVDPQDTAAVLDCLAVIPAQAAGDSISVYKREKGKWTDDPAALAAIQGPTPPPLVELDPDMLSSVLDQMDAPADVAEHLDQLAQGGHDRNRGNAERLRRYWVHGEGAAKIQWGVPGDYNRCVVELGKYMGERAHGYCQLRHKDATGFYAGHAPSEQRPHGLAAALVGEVQTGDELGMPTPPPMVDPDLPHDYAGPGVESDLFENECPMCGRPLNHVIHVVAVGEPQSEAPAGDDSAIDGIPEPDDDDAVPVAADPEAPHSFVPSADGLCEVCGLVATEPLHEIAAEQEFGADELAAPDAAAPVADYSLPHVFVQSPDPSDPPGTCDCGRDESDAMHVDANAAPLAAAASVLANSAEDVVAGQRFKIPLIVPEGVESGDGRKFAANSLTSRPTPLALMWQPEGGDGHDGAVIVGRIDHVERIGNGLGNGYGVFDTGEHGQEAVRLVKGGMLRGISADLDEFEADKVGGGESEDKVTSTKLLVNSGRLMGITLVAKPAYPECVIELDDEGDGEVPDGEYSQDSGEARVAALIASAAPLTPPKSWFTNPGLSKPTHLTVDDDGRVFGHIAAWNVDHIGLPFGTRAPRSASGYAYFRTGVIRTAEGDDVPVGQLTLAGGHAPLQADARTAVKHYDDTASAVADLAAGEDKYGIWVAGALRPGVQPEQVRALRASSPSGDWRPIKGSLELVAVCQVNVPGFPVARAMVSSGVVTALVAAGCIAMEPEEKELDTATIDQRIAALEAAEKKRLAAAALSIRERMSPALTKRHETLTAAAQAAQARVDVVRNERKAMLAARKAEVVARVAAGFPGKFTEDLHPRDNHGKFRQILARLTELLHGEHDAKPGLRHIEDAVLKEGEGNHSGAAAAAHEGANKLEAAAHAATGTAKAKLHDAAAIVRDAAGAEGSVQPEDPILAKLSEEMKQIIEHAVIESERKLSPITPQGLKDAIKQYLTGTAVASPEDLKRFIESQLKRTVKPPKLKPVKRIVPGSRPVPPTIK